MQVGKRHILNELTLDGEAIKAQPDINADNIILNAFRIAVNGALTQQNMIDGIVDEYEDETGIDVASSTNEEYNSGSKYYAPSRTEAGVDDDVVLMLQADGPDGSKEIVDNGNTGHIVTQNSSAALSAAQTKFGSTACVFNGSSSYLSIPDSSDWALGTGDFTIDTWIYLNSTARQAIVSQGSSGSAEWMLEVSGSNTLRWIVVNSTLQVDIANAWTPTTGNWYHIAITKSSNVYRMFVNGSQIGSDQTDSYSIPDFSGSLYIGAQVGSSIFLNGYIDEFRISNTARWTTAFTAPTSAHTSDSNTKLLLHMDTQDVSDSSHIPIFYGNTSLSTTQKKFSTSSLYFDGSGDYAIMSESITDFEFGSGDFTIDWWDYRVSLVHASCPIARELNGGTRPAFVLGMDNSGSSNLEVYIKNTSDWDIANGKSLGTRDANTWNHYAVVRSGNTWYCFKNGTQTDTWTDSKAIQTNVQTGLLLGQQRNSFYFNGYIDELRVSKGVARWTTAFTPPIAKYSLLAEIFNMSLISESQTAETEPDSARIIILEEDVDTPTLNTDIKAYVTRDGGTSWSQATLADIGNYDSSKRVLAATVDISGQGSGTSMEYKIETLNNTDLKLHAASLNWD